jgi:hypothetical protein
MNPVIASLFTAPPVRSLPYLDPGTGSFLLQILIAAGMSVLFVLSLFRKKLAAFFSRLLGGKPADPARKSDESDDE